MNLRIIYWNDSKQIFDVREGGKPKWNLSILKSYIYANVFKRDPNFKKFSATYYEYANFSHATLEIVKAN